MSEDAEARCPYCGAQIDYSPDQDGSCDYYCTRCSWHQHVPGDGEMAEFKGKEGILTAVTSHALARLKVDLELLKEQVAILGKVIDGNALTDGERSCLEGLWEFVHSIIDCIESSHSREGSG